jgi:transposase
MNTFARLFYIFYPAFFLTAAVSSAEEMKTLTDQEGRSIRAEVIAVEGEQVRIRREDGQVFNLPMARLSEASGKELREWAKEQAAKPQPLPPGAFQVQMSRVRFSAESTESDVKLTSGDTVKNGRVTTEEKWGFSFMLTNRTSAPLTGLRAEYLLFATMDDVHKEGKKEGLRRVRHNARLEDLPAQGRMDFRTESVSAFKMRYKGNIVSAKTGESSSRETLHGIWIKMYRGDELIYEAASPEGLMREEKW